MYEFGNAGAEQCGYVREESLGTVSGQSGEIGGAAVWTLSSSKEGSGVAQLRDDNPETFWQSDGTVPHTVTLQFLRKTRVSEVALYLDYRSDESYTPEIVQIRGGLHLQDLREVTRVALREPNGWIRIPLISLTTTGERIPWVSAHNIQIAVLQMHSLGKDTHIRQMKVFGPFEDESAAVSLSPQIFR